MVSGSAKMFELKEWCTQFIKLSGVLSATILIFSLVVLSCCRKTEPGEEPYDELVEKTSSEIVCWRFYCCKEWVEEKYSDCKEWVREKNPTCKQLFKLFLLVILFLYIFQVIIYMILKIK
jgi:hypothetical protein